MIVDPVVQLGAGAAWRLALVAVIGGATPWAIGGWWRAWWKQACAVGACCAVATIARWPSMLGVQTLPLTLGLGLWAWFSVRLTGTSRIGGLAWLGVSGAAVAAGAAILLGGLFDVAPSVTAVPPITREDRARLEDILRLAADTGEEVVEVELSATDLNGLAAAWLAPPLLLSNLLLAFRPLAVPAGDVVVAHGAVDDEISFFSSGRLTVRDGSGKDLGGIGAGEFFGEMSPLYRQPRSATVRAEVPCDLLVLDGAAFRRILGDFPSFEAEMRRIAAGRHAQPAPRSQASPG
ncbi:MAG: cyclic nucleotide-binding domain-containing protein [Planctomycetia bacterium]